MQLYVTSDPSDLNLSETTKVLRHGCKNVENQSFLRKESAKFVGCLHDKDHIKSPRESHFVLFLHG